jgi:hypothetical protein
MISANLMQLDHLGKEHITSLRPSAEDRETMQWLMGLEEAAPGTTIFVHRLSDPGHYLCMVPAVYTCLEEDPIQPTRDCGCFICIDRRKWLLDYTARAIIPDMFRLIPPEVVRGMQAKDTLEGLNNVG